jgi:hypothetical protein
LPSSGSATWCDGSRDDKKARENGLFDIDGAVSSSVLCDDWRRAELVIDAGPEDVVVRACISLVRGSAKNLVVPKSMRVLGFGAAGGTASEDQGQGTAAGKADMSAGMRA